MKYVVKYLLFTKKPQNMYENMYMYENPKICEIWKTMFEFLRCHLDKTLVCEVSVRSGFV